jgi:hypothetical protein
LEVLLFAVNIHTSPRPFSSSRWIAASYLARSCSTFATTAEASMYHEAL